ncbi:inositol 1,4,5-triphosphate receptor associated 1 [Tachyglossus aculeatus]|uniref:inositol 1,4,5-triphosphate receptor associated 1 n=1 Tax=Tachyglossus aculeatus TaxID=9261 RepID=UPI0018F4DF48|nr:inositol 1,4,5-triphosphate receptor associated 1 [Tachyglossus aculeatus]
MPTYPEDEEQLAESHSPASPTGQGSPVEGTTCNAPSIVLPENAVTPDVEIDKNLVNRVHSPHRRLSHRHLRTSVASPTSIDKAGRIIDLVYDLLPDVKISEEDKKRNLQLLEEAKKVSERFLTRRGRKSRSTLSDSPSAASPNPSPKASPTSSRSSSLTLSPQPGAEAGTAPPSGPTVPLQNASKGLTDRKQNDQRKVSPGRLSPRPLSLEKSQETLSEHKENFDPRQPTENPPKGSASGGDGGKMSLNSPPGGGESELGKPLLKKPKESELPLRSSPQGPGPLSARGSGSGPEQADPRVAPKVDLKISTPLRPPLLRGVPWDGGPGEPGTREKGVPRPLASEEEKRSPPTPKSSNKLLRSPGFKDFQIQVQPVRMQKLSKLREEHIMMRNQNLVGLKLPELSEAAEQEKGPASGLPPATEEDETKNGSEVMPNISDVLLRKLRVHKSLPGSAPPLTEKEVENVFVQLSLAFRNDSYTLESRISLAERERNLTEENTEKELDNFKASITCSTSAGQQCEAREGCQKLLEDIAVLHRLAARLSSRAEVVGAVRQEKRMSKATEVMMQYVENLKRTYEKDHAELMEFKKLANQNSSRSYSPSEDGTPRTSRSMSLTLGKNMPRRRVSVAVVPKFNALNAPGQPPGTSPLPTLPATAESPNGKSVPVSSPALPALLENGRSNGDQDCYFPAPALAQSCVEEISPETKAKIEEEAFNKGYQEGLKKTKELQELKGEEEEKKNEGPDEPEESEIEEEQKDLKNSKLEEFLTSLQILYPKLCEHWNVVRIVAAALLVLAVGLSLYNSSGPCGGPSDTPPGKATCSAAQPHPWWKSGLQHKQGTEQ